jgi:hypothetical protein
MAATNGRLPVFDGGQGIAIRLVIAGHFVGLPGMHASWIHIPTRPVVAP